MHCLYFMHQSISAAPSPPPPGYCGVFARLVSPGGGAFANPGAILELLTARGKADRLICQGQE